jgi:PST family polysaccharide transporter
VARALGYHPALAPLLALIGVALVAQSVARPAEDVLRAFERMPVLMRASIAISLGTAPAGITLLILGFGLEVLVLLQGVSAWVEAALLLLLVHRRATPLRWEPSLAALRHVAREGALLFFLVLFEFTATRIDVLILARLRGPDAVGLYIPAVRIVEYVTLLRAGAGAALFPFLAARWGGEPERLGRAYQQALRLYALYTVGSAVVLTFGAEAILGLLFGPTYLPGVPALELLAWAMVLDALAGPFAEVVLVHRQPLARFVPVAGVLAALNVGLNLWIVPRWAHVGAALAALVTAGASMVARRSCLRRVLPPESLALGPVAWRPVLGGLPWLRPSSWGNRSASGRRSSRRACST